MINPQDLHAYADGETTPEEIALLEGEMSSEDHDFVAQIRAYRADVVLRVDPVDHASSWPAARARLAELKRARRVESFVGRYAWGLSGAFGLALLMVGLRNQSIDPGRLDGTDLVRMAASLGSTTSKPAGDAAQKAWLDGLLGRAAASIDPNRLEVVGVPAEGYVEGQRVTRLTLRDASGDLALLVVHAPQTFGDMADLGGGFRGGRMGVVNCVAWSDGGAGMVLCGNRSFASLQETAKKILRRP